ncbi:MAG: DUF3795 domain-containing protein [Oscillospiraceae bacterium]|nr:DUF3795 domain-containing protein [Oscillospiraceae bacterium]
MTCCDCLLANNEINDTAKKFKEAMESHDFIRFLKHFSKITSLPFFQDFKQTDEFMNMLNKIISMKCDSLCMEARGCSVPQADEIMVGMVNKAHKCDVLVCIESKGVEGCWDCSELEDCDKKKMFNRTYGNSPVETCKIVRDKGKEAVEPRGNKYYKWQQ